MSLKDIDISDSYDTDEDDALNSFYIPALKESIEYLRLSGFFSSTSLALAAEGIAGFIENKGTMKLVTGAFVNQDDIEAIIQGQISKELAVERSINFDLDHIEEEFIRDHVSALCWMIKNGKLEIKIALVLNDMGIPEDASTLQKKGIFHTKIGILKDKGGNMISFSGSENETAKGWKDNIEDFKVFRDWVDGQQGFVSRDINKFNKFWSPHEIKRRTVVMEVPDAVRQKMIRMAPPDEETTKQALNRWINQSKVKKKRMEPFKCQTEACIAFRENNFKGILKMATGTGKTFTACLCVNDYFDAIKALNNRILILVPQQNLVEQWINDLKDFFSEEYFFYRYHSDVSRAERSKAREAWRYLPDDTNLFLVSTVDSLDSLKNVFLIKPNITIGDEVHSYGTEKRMRTISSIIGEAKYSLGISATPERYYDRDGTDMLIDYFGKIIYKYDIAEAQRDKILSEYLYCPYVVELTSAEEHQVKIFTQRLGRMFAGDYTAEISERDAIRTSSVERLLNQRAKIIKKCENKITGLRRILTDHGEDLNQCIVYCEDTDQVDQAQTVFDDLGIASYVKYHTGIENRDEALDLFKSKNCNFILSINCLDQGVNIPSCESLILLSNTGNPRQYIQRRGRVLRNPPGRVKPIVKIFDIVPVPPAPDNIFQSIVMSQMVRMWEFIRCSLSPEAKQTIERLMEDYDINDDDLNKVIEEWK